MGLLIIHSKAQGSEAALSGREKKIQLFMLIQTLAHE